MRTLAARNRRTAVLTCAGVGFFHLVAFAVVMLLLSAGRGGSDRTVPLRPTMRLPALPQPVVTPHVDADMSTDREIDERWAARHKDVRSPWSVGADGHITWR